MNRTRPGPLRRIGYLLGRPLPESMREWVRNDLTGPGHSARYFIRGLIPLIPLLLIFAFIPGNVWLRVGMILLLLIPFLYFQIALVNVYRKHLLRNNGLDPKLADKQQIVRVNATREAYYNRLNAAGRSVDPQRDVRPGPLAPPSTANDRVIDADNTGSDEQSQ